MGNLTRNGERQGQNSRITRKCRDKKPSEQAGTISRAPGVRLYLFPSINSQFGGHNRQISKYDKRTVRLSREISAVAGSIRVRDCNGDRLHIARGAVALLKPQRDTPISPLFHFECIASLTQTLVVDNFRPSSQHRQSGFK